MKERVLAVIGAICLIAVAVLVRSALADDGGSGSDNDAPSSKDRPVVACTRDLAEVCAALADDGQIAADPPTLDLGDASAPPDDVDGWITWDPADQLADFDLDPSGEGIWGDPQVLGSGALAVAATAGDLDVACPQAPTWACIKASEDEGLTIGVGDPTTAEGAARLLPAARTFATDDEYATLEPGLRQLVDGPVDGQSPASAMARLLVTRPGAINMVVGPTSVLEREAETERGQARRLQVVTPTPAASASIIVTDRDGRAADQVHRAVCDDDGAEGAAAQALEDAGADTLCRGETIDSHLAGFLYQVRKELS